MEYKIEKDGYEPEDWDHMLAQTTPGQYVVKDKYGTYAECVVRGTTSLWRYHHGNFWDCAFTLKSGPGDDLAQVQAEVKRSIESDRLDRLALHAGLDTSDGMRRED